MWDFETDPEYQAELDWVDEFVRNEVEPVDMVIKHAYDLKDHFARSSSHRCSRRCATAACGPATSVRISADRATGR